MREREMPKNIFLIYHVRVHIKIRKRVRRIILYTIRINF